MRRLACIGALLALAVAVTACGTTQKEKERDPLGNGATDSPSVEVDSVDALRATTVEIQDGNFLPPRVSLKIDNTLTFVNRDSKTYTLKGRNTAGNASFRPVQLKPQQSVEREFVNEGEVEVRIEGSSETMKVGVFY